MRDEELTEKVQIDAFGDTAEIAAPRLRRLTTEPQWPPPPPAPAPIARRARVYDAAKLAGH